MLLGKEVVRYSVKITIMEMYEIVRACIYLSYVLQICGVAM